MFLTVGISVSVMDFKHRSCRIKDRFDFLLRFGRNWVVTALTVRCVASERGTGPGKEGCSPTEHMPYQK